MRETAAGRGRLFLDPAKQHDDLRLWRRAIRERWEIDDDFKLLAIQRLRSIVETGDDDVALKAISETRQMVAQNQKDEHKVIDVRVTTRHDELSGIAADLGIEIGALENAERESGVGTEGTAASVVEVIPDGAGH